ncbi:hypothetical protein RvY_00870 [Ramazzottius varieornatus]|uniref:Chromo domain-containing protein n=1 Tax=Ramazzottius varieornatus TaxID=947166 RepID=A0A1D1UIA9_RAMVA|nr:hypothetical protein RvY_00870 [Ramazzottius varieornatus]
MKKKIGGGSEATKHIFRQHIPVSSTKRIPVEAKDNATVPERPPYWYVEEIRGVRVNDCGGLEYLVRWTGFSESGNPNTSWEPEHNCQLAIAKIREFYSRMPKDDREYFTARATLRAPSKLDLLLRDKKRTRKDEEAGDGHERSDIEYSPTISA